MDEINLENKSSKTLASIVVAYRLLGWNEKQSIKAMEILSKRETSGDTFDYKSFINDAVKNSQKPTLKKSNQSSLFGQSNLENILMSLIKNNG